MLWLEGNGFNKIQGLTHLTLLRTLYLHENIIEKIEGLETLKDLDLINLSHNFITKVENLDNCSQLTTLNISHNRLTTKADIEHVLLLPKLQTLDLQHNKLNDPSVIDVLEVMPDLRVVYLMGNPMVKDIPHYRKVVIGRCKHLCYLDDRPVFEEERRRVDKWYEAYLSQGLETATQAERAELAVIRKEKEEAEERNFKAFEELMKRGQQIKREREAANGQPLLPVDINAFTGETILPVPESDIVKENRERRWGQSVAIFDEESVALGPTAEARDAGGIDQTASQGDTPIHTETPTEDTLSLDKPKGKFLGLLDDAMREESACVTLSKELD